MEFRISVGARTLGVAESSGLEETIPLGDGDLSILDPFTDLACVHDVNWPSGIQSRPLKLIPHFSSKSTLICYTPKSVSAASPTAWRLPLLLYRHHFGSNTAISHIISIFIILWPPLLSAHAKALTPPFEIDWFRQPITPMKEFQLLVFPDKAFRNGAIHSSKLAALRIVKDRISSRRPRYRLITVRKRSWSRLVSRVVAPLASCGDALQVGGLGKLAEDEADAADEVVPERRMLAPCAEGDDVQASEHEPGRRFGGVEALTDVVAAVGRLAVEFGQECLVGPERLATGHDDHDHVVVDDTFGVGSPVRGVVIKCSVGSLIKCSTNRILEGKYHLGLFVFRACAFWRWRRAATTAAEARACGRIGERSVDVAVNAPAWGRRIGASEASSECTNMGPAHRRVGSKRSAAKTSGYAPWYCLTPERRDAKKRRGLVAAAPRGRRPPARPRASDDGVDAEFAALLRETPRGLAPSDAFEPADVVALTLEALRRPSGASSLERLAAADFRPAGCATLDALYAAEEDSQYALLFDDYAYDVDDDALVLGDDAFVNVRLESAAGELLVRLGWELRRGDDGWWRQANCCEDDDVVQVPCNEQTESDVRVGKRNSRQHWVFDVLPEVEEGYEQGDATTLQGLHDSGECAIGPLKGHAAVVFRSEPSQESVRRGGLLAHTRRPASLSFFDNSSSGLPSRRQQRDAIAYLHATRYLCGYFGDPSDPDNWSIVRKASLSLTNEIRRTMPNEVVWSPMRYLAIVNRVKEECVLASTSSALDDRRESGGRGELLGLGWALIHPGVDCQGSLSSIAGPGHRHALRMAANILGDFEGVHWHGTPSLAGRVPETSALN
ncbi:hypothetical protein AURANDRAFT_66169 [Aureococcus anophagefferens]|uniref:Uncharacterized protein n=1 Tax=Aureococcus anophagefferens TaxID=44056 RepID=F0YGL8_AURAN|nr:hypothetical protein AURANDRAFT_66169 [Aureococcus anophagefferens]EGB05692.1 hypothetical protein AURANDRAFT_66169 [Aureococcus anophagefferens]|eukprot:XP_009039532.1 hypothetical protein AURANDRAFT_66169 [Aureococcus anophagefferens]